MPWPTNRPPLDYMDERAPAMPYEEPERPFPAIGIPLSQAEPLQLGIAQTPQIPSYQLQEPTGVPQAQAPRLRGLPNLSMPGPEYSPSSLPQVPPPDMSPEALARVMALGGMAGPGAQATQPAKTSAAVPYLPRLGQTEEGRRGREQAARTADALRGLARVLSFAVTHDAAADAASRAQPTQSQLLRQTMEQERQTLRSENAQEEGAYNARQDRVRGLEEHAQDRASRLSAAAAEAQRTAELRDPADPRNQSAQQQLASILAQSGMPDEEIQRIVTPIALGDDASIEMALATTGLYSANARAALDRAIRAMKVAHRGGSGGRAAASTSPEETRAIFVRNLVNSGRTQDAAEQEARATSLSLMEEENSKNRLAATTTSGREGAKQVSKQEVRRIRGVAARARNAMASLNPEQRETVLDIFAGEGGPDSGSWITAPERAFKYVRGGIARYNARDNQQIKDAIRAIAAIRNAQIHDVSGAAVTSSELTRLQTEFGSGTFVDVNALDDYVGEFEASLPPGVEVAGDVGGESSEQPQAQQQTRSPSNTAGSSIRVRKQRPDGTYVYGTVPRDAELRPGWEAL